MQGTVREEGAKPTPKGGTWSGSSRGRRYRRSWGGRGFRRDTPSRSPLAFCNLAAVAARTVFKFPSLELSSSEHAQYPCGGLFPLGSVTGQGQGDCRGRIPTAPSFAHPGTPGGVGLWGRDTLPTVAATACPRTCVE